MPRSRMVMGALAMAPLLMGSTLEAQQTNTPLLACYVPRSGTLYLVGQNGAPGTCRAADHVLVQWSAVGPTGPQGPAGPQGPPGTGSSLAGSATLGNVETVVANVSFTFTQPGTQTFVTATCPTGKIAISGGLLRDDSNGGYSPGSGSPWVHELGSYPNKAFGYSDREWVVHLSAQSVGTFRARLVVTCARIN